MKKGKTMIQVRQGVFETNSSSTHSICIPKKCDKIINHVDFRIGEYGWENDEADPASYLYTGVLCAYKKDEAQELINDIANFLVTNDISFTFEKPEYDEYNHLSYEQGYIDHGYELREFIEYILNDGETFLRYLSGGIVYTGNDNQDPQPSGCDICDEDYYDYDLDKYVPNPYHDIENYEYFYKGN